MNKHIQRYIAQAHHVQQLKAQEEQRLRAFGKLVFWAVLAVLAGVIAL